MWLMKEYRNKEVRDLMLLLLSLFLALVYTRFSQYMQC